MSMHNFDSKYFGNDAVTDRASIQLPSNRKSDTGFQLQCLDCLDLFRGQGLENTFRMRFGHCTQDLLKIVNKIIKIGL